jgi:hypothetical protein
MISLSSRVALLLDHTHFHLVFVVLLNSLHTVILGIWTLVSTPTAELEYIDGRDHWVCDTGGFTGPPGGYVFFFILVGYGVCAVLCTLHCANSILFIAYQ